MATTITAGNGTNGGAAISSDNTGILELKTGTGSGTTAMTVDTSGNVGIGTLNVSPPDRLTVSGIGETGAPADGGSKSASIRVTSSGGNANDGGQIEFGAGFGSFSQSYFSAIKGLLSNNVGNTLGSLAFYTRNATGDTSLTERARITSDGLFQFNSGYGSVATAYGCRAWVNFNGTGVVAIRASGNVSSITDNNTGDYTVNFTTAMPDANYVINTTTQNNRGSGVAHGATLPTASAVRIITFIPNTLANADDAYIFVSIFR